ncbi:hypothetical protein CDL62_06370 [Alkalitalea saponilacus]|nr:hypothetical protein CDL62_06370 [Alkalitalea saponilacus]
MHTCAFAVMKRITIKDIAKELGLHHSTVSRALRFSSVINPATRDRVINYAESKGYQVNRNALQLRGLGSNIIGVIVPNIHHNFFSNFVSNITRKAFESGYIVAVFQSEESLKQETEIIHSIIQQNLAGVVSSHSMETQDTSHFNLLEKYKIPLVCFDRVNSSLKKSSVVLKNESALKSVVMRLGKEGYSKVAYFSGSSSIQLFKDRQRGYTLGVKEIKSSYLNCINIPGAFSVQKGKEIAKELFRIREKPDAIVFDSHFLALGALNYLKESEPDRLKTIGIASFGADTFSPVSSIKTLIIKQPEKEMAEMAFSLLMEAIRHPDDHDIKTMEFNAEIIDNNIK